jgi:hypothetical protein
MKRPLEEAAELFRENENLAGSDREKANLYHGLALLAEEMRRIEKEMADVEEELQSGPSYFYHRRPAVLVRRSGTREVER